MSRYFVALFLLSFAACGPQTPPVQHPRPRPPTDTPRCPDACAHLRDLNCEEGQPLEDGTSCEDFCASTQENGHALSPSCVVNIRQCSDMDRLDSFCPSP